MLVPTHADTLTASVLQCFGDVTFFRKWIQKDPPTPRFLSQSLVLIRHRLWAHLCSDPENQIEVGVSEEPTQEWNGNQVGYHGEELQHR